ncbi:MAG: HlyD family efflux transporter periplasmic adaptor subunit [Thiotrichales bacterium]|nr:HlyD family efflux transporter periplasmic adaptor subunit [Thiotrichales bacterium]
MSVAKLVAFVKNAAIPLLILVLAVTVFMYFKSTKPTQPPVEVKQKVWPVKVETVQLQSLSPVQTLFGTIQSNAMVSAAAPVTGQVGKVWLNEGEEFSAGQALVSLADSDLQLPYQIAKADVEDMQAQLAIEKLAYQANQQKLLNEQKVLELKKTDAERNRQLFKKNLASQSAVDQSKEALVRQEYAVVGAELSVQQHQVTAQQLVARLAKAQANYEQAKINLSRGHLVAPYAGRLAQVKVSQGDRVSVGSPLVQFYAFDSLELKARLPIDVMPSVYQSLQSGQTLKALYRLNEQIFELPFSRLAGESSTSGVDAFFKVPTELKFARPGDLWQVSLVLPVQQSVFAMPYSAIYGTENLYVVKEGVMQIERVKNLGETRIDGVSYALLKAEEGKTLEGAQVVVTHLPNAISGLKVSVVNGDE